MAMKYSYLNFGTSVGWRKVPHYTLVQKNISIMVVKLVHQKQKLAPILRGLLLRESKVFLYLHLHLDFMSQANLRFQQLRQPILQLRRGKIWCNGWWKRVSCSGCYPGLDVVGDVDNNRWRPQNCPSSDKEQTRIHRYPCCVAFYVWRESA